MPQVAIPLRVAVAGTTQTPAIDAVLEILGKQTVLERIATAV
jgi:glutamyl-tRNA synthetase